MSEDRELLELAAKAAKIPLDFWTDGQEPYSGGEGFVLPSNRLWNPLADDGDALRLALCVGPLELSIGEYGSAVRRPKGQWQGCEAHLHGGKQAATRRAIVRAAAEIGKSMINVLQEQGGN